MSWFEHSFGDQYLKLYAHRSEAEAETAMDCLLSHRPWEGISGGPVLDVACGAGRHLKALRSRGATAVGVDLSAALLRAAQSSVGGGIARADMRSLPFGDRSFSLLCCMFTSFGYFEDHAAHADLAAEFARVSAKEILLDLPDAAWLEERLVPQSERKVGEWLIRERRWIDGPPSRVCKDTWLFSADGKVELDKFEERVLLFKAQEVDAFFEAAAFEPIARHGDYDGRAWVAGEASRQLILYRRVGA